MTASANSDEVLALGLARGLPVGRAARRARVSKRTAYRRMAEQDFVARVRELRTEMMRRAVGVLAGGMGRAAGELRKLVKSDDERVRLRATVALLEYGIRLREHDELTARVEALEARASGQAGDGGTWTPRAFPPAPGANGHDGGDAG